MQGLSKHTSTRTNGVTVHVMANDGPEQWEAGRVIVEIVDQSKVIIRVERDDESWFGSVNLEAS